MRFRKVKINSKAQAFHRSFEGIANTLVRRYDGVKRHIGLQGRKANYDDLAYEFVGGAGEELRLKHYDKSLKLLWKAERLAPWSSFHDCTREERQLLALADQALNAKEKVARHQLTRPEFKERLRQEYTLRERQAIVNVLSAIGHGEAYAWLVASDLLREVQSTGARAALTMQVMEEAKHFVVLRELVRAFDVSIPRLSAWEYLFLEEAYKAQGLEKFFGMNVLIEAIALGIFGMFSTFPHLEILRMFHLDEARHTALPANYFQAFPLATKEKKRLSNRVTRLKMVLPVIPFIFYMEEDLAELGIDVFEFGGSVARKVLHLTERIGFQLPIPNHSLTYLFNEMFNAYCSRTRLGHTHRNFMDSETTLGEKEIQVEREIFNTPARNYELGMTN